MTSCFVFSVFVQRVLFRHETGHHPDGSHDHVLLLHGLVVVGFLDDHRHGGVRVVPRVRSRHLRLREDRLTLATRRVRCNVIDDFTMSSRSIKLAVS